MKNKKQVIVVKKISKKMQEMLDAAGYIVMIV